jgi:hypothetical protein
MIIILPGNWLGERGSKRLKKERLRGLMRR